MSNTRSEGGFVVTTYYGGHDKGRLVEIYDAPSRLQIRGITLDNIRSLRKLLEWAETDLAPTAAMESAPTSPDRP